MTARARLALFVLGVAAAAPLMVAALVDLPRFGHPTSPYGELAAVAAPALRHTANAVASVVFDIRGIDTLGEEFILFAAVVGVTVLLSLERENGDGPRDRAEQRTAEFPASDAVRVACLAATAPLTLLGLYVVAHGHVSPGGGFQGGVVLATPLVLVSLAGRYVAFERGEPRRLLDAGEGLGAGGFVAVGLVTLTGGAFLFNGLPDGRLGELGSAGILPLLNLTVGLEVAAGVVLVVYDLLEQTLVVRRRGRDRS